MTPGLSVARQASTRRLFAVYAAVSLLPVLALGIVLSALMHRQATSAGLREGASEALVVARSSVAPLLDGHDLRQGLRADEKTRLDSRGTLIGGNEQVLRLRLRDLAGRVVWSADDTAVGTIDDEAVDAAAGESVTHLQWLNADDGDAGHRGPRLVEAYVPLSSAQNGTRIGVVEIYLPYAPIRASIAAGQHLLMGALMGGLFVLWLALLGVSASVTRALRRHARTNAFLAHHDPLTGLPNRSQFADRAAVAIENGDEARQVALAVIDLDRFKEVNDTLGHGNGDQLLVALAQRLSVHLREADLVARLGGDEFGVILTGVHGPGEAVEILTRLRAVLAEPITLGALPLALEASVGFAMAPGDGGDADALLARADLAMYVAKREHRGVVHYRPDHDRHDAANLTLIAELGQAIARDELRLHFQPKADLRHAKVTAVEALVRWEHPVRGLLYPDAFLPAVEQTELVEPLTRWVLAHAVQALDELDPSGALAVAVNISARSLVRPDFAEDILAILDVSGVDRRRVILEITETALLADPDRAARTLTTLARHGIRISVDDFGAGQTSLGYLARLPISELKIDKAFVLAMTTDPRNAAIVRSVIELGHSLGFTVTAEGVETADALADLTAAECDLVQGYFLARPMQLDRLRQALPDIADAAGLRPQPAIANPN